MTARTMRAPRALRAVPPPDEAPPALQLPEFAPLRAALDWCTLLYRVFVSAKVWKHLRAIATEGNRVVGITTPEGDVIPLDVRMMGNDAAILLKGPGVWCKVKNPAARPQNDGSKDDGVELQVQGAALAAQSDNGVSTILAIRSGINGLLFRHFGTTRAQRATALRAHVRPGRFDVAFDVAVIGPDARPWIEGELFAHGNLTDATRAIVTRARRPKTIADVTEHVTERPRKTERPERIIGRQQGTETAGRTLYVGSQVCLRIYEKDKEPSDTSKLLRSTLKASCGWDGESPVLRWEIEVKRDWFRDQIAIIDGQQIRGDALTADDFLENASIFARTVLSRFRHTDDAPGARKNRPNSAYYNAVTHAMHLFTLRDEKPNMETIMSKKREAFGRRNAVQGVGAVVDAAAKGKHPYTRVVAQLRFLGFRDWLDEYESRPDHWLKRYHGLRQRLGIEAPPTLDHLTHDDEEEQLTG